jgi:hypothetical protein
VVIVLSYVYDGKAENLPPGYSRTYSVTLAVHAPSGINFTGHPKSVVMKSDGFDYIFEDALSFPVKVENKLDEDATLLDAGEWMDPISTTPANTSTTPAIGTVYTVTPVFTFTSETFPARAVWEIKPDPSNNYVETCFITICKYE